MITERTPYENLFNSMKNSFTVENDHKEYTLGAFMRMKANEQKNNGSNTNLPIEVKAKNMLIPVRSVLQSISDKLAIKAPPKQERIIRAFPLRTSLTALCSAIMICLSVFSFGFLSGQQQEEAPALIASETITESETVTAMAEVEE